ncbi:hypothetical protein HPB50_003898 [Hyalomma asiaticum]|uniref:Uncharacterized protein n=1 Tax=Hyalomma asiaticum TaxID=266040 RepID=A0ACB7T5G3_HYAAI|nr:hypothetical protein HPB50_003898 [Hyalomma asiaticum]
MGAALGYSSPVVTSEWTTPIEDGIAAQSAASSVWFNFLLPIGAVFGSGLGALASQAMGRRFALFCSALVYMVGYATIFTNTAHYAVLCGRFVTGLATGMVSLCVPAYIAEVTLPAQRGSMGGVLQLAITVGILLSYVIGRLLEWQLLAAAGFACSLLLAVLNQYSVESPRWLVLSGRRMDAVEALWKLRGTSGKVDEECHAIEQVFARAPTRLSHVLLAAHAHFIQQFSGINMIIFYASSLFTESGISISAADCSIIVAVTMVVVSLMDVVGRRRLLLFSCLTCVGAMATIAALYPMSAPSEAKVPGSLVQRLPILLLALYIMGYSLGLGPVVWILGAELVCCRDRGMYLAAVCAFNWACVLLVTWFFTSVRDTVHLSGLAWFFCLVTIVGAFLLMMFMPETQGQSLEQILLGNFRQPEGSSVHSPKPFLWKRM